MQDHNILRHLVCFAARRRRRSLLFGPLLCGILHADFGEL